MIHENDKPIRGEVVQGGIRDTSGNIRTVDTGSIPVGDRVVVREGQARQVFSD